MGGGLLQQSSQPHMAFPTLLTVSNAIGPLNTHMFADLMGAVASEGRAHFDKLFSFLQTVSSPLRKDLMKRAGRDASEQTKSPKQARATWKKPQDGDGTSAEQLIKAEPSAREIAAAKAARERLYGSGDQVS